MSGKQPRVSVGVPVFNGDNFLAEALDSVLAQTFGDFEVVISDNPRGVLEFQASPGTRARGLLHVAGSR
jgi:GT2 family glycosyltransferase